MKFFYKMFLGMTAILAAALGVVEYATVSYTLEHAIQREQESALSQHQMVKYSIETVILNMNGDNVESELSDMMSQSAKSLVGDDGGIYLADTDGSATYIDACNCPVDDTNISDGKLTYSIVSYSNNENADHNSSESNSNTDTNINTNINTNKYIHVISNFKLDDNKYTLLTEKNVTAVFDESKELQRRCGIYYVVILGVGMAVILVLSWMITKPLARLTATTGKFAEGDYKARSDVKTQDEIGELAAAFNDMAQALENKIYELQIAAKKQEDFTANFAHELKTPMTSIIGYADTLYQKNMTPDEVHSAAGVILNEGMRLEALSFKLLELITLDKNDFQLEETQIKEVVADCVDTAREAAKKHDTVLSYSADEAWVWLEYDLFKTMLLNLIDNAVKSGGSSVKVSGEYIDNNSNSYDAGNRLDKSYADDKKVSYRYYRITVSDNGRGIPPEDMERITEAFYMVDKSRSRSEHGAGLGLALVSKIAELHNIQIHYESKIDEGTKVYFDMKAEGTDEE